MDHGTGDVRPTALASTRDAIVNVRSLSKRYGDIIVLDDLTFTLEEGTVTGFLGPNGAGKTTTLRLLLGLAAPSSGQALVFGHPYQDLDSPVRRVGAVLDIHDLHPARSGREHLRVLALATGIPDTRVEEVLAMVELDAAADRRVRTLLGLGLFAVALHAFSLSPDRLITVTDQMRVFGWGVLAALFAGIAGAMTIATEFRHGTIRSNAGVIRGGWSQARATVGLSVRESRSERSGARSGSTVSRGVCPGQERTPERMVQRGRR